MKGSPEPGALAKALYSNTPEAKNELLFRKGDILTVIEYDHEGQPGWWLCSHRGQRGICPSNYLQLLEDNYSFLDRNRPHLQRSLSHSGESCESALNEGEGNAGDFDPLETYDVPRSCMQNSAKSPIPVDDPVLYSNQPLYQNEEQASPGITKTSPLDLYDVPRSQLPIYGQSQSRLRRYGQASESSLVSRGTNSSLQNLKDWNNASGRSVSSCDLGLPPSGTRKANNNKSFLINCKSNLSATSINTILPTNSIQRPHTNGSISQQTSGNRTSSPVQLRNSHHRLQNYSISSSTGFPINHSNRSSIQSESAESGIVMLSSSQTSQQTGQDLYDVPRSAISVHNSVTATNNNGHENGTGGGSNSRPHSSLSVSSSGMGLSIANSDSKDSLDLYDVPRSAKSYVTHMETKYDQIQNRQGSGGGSNSSLSRDSTLPGHSRHNSTSSIFSAYGFTRKGSGGGFADGKRPSNGSISNFGRSSITSSRSSVDTPDYPTNDLYDVPRSSNCVPPPNPRTNRRANGASSSSVASSRSQVSLSESDSGMLYDVPPSFTRKISLCDSSETLSYKETASESGGSRGELKLGASSSSLSTSPKSRTNEHPKIVVSAGVSSCAEVKILPLGPTAAVSVSEKLRQEVVTSITSILDHVKPKWRSKENLTAIMADLRFSCVRLGLAIKDIAEFATRSMSNANKVGDDTLVTKLHRLLIPVMNGSQIIQRDVDELDIYMWSVDRLSVTPGSHNEKGDALDQLILCARSLKHDVTELCNFLALNSSILFRVQDVLGAVKPSTKVVESKVEDTQEDYDYVSLMSTSEAQNPPSTACSSSLKSQSEATPRPISSAVPVQLDSSDQQLLEFYSAQIGVTAPLLSQSISTFISSIHQNQPPECFNIHVKYVILLAYKMLFAGDTCHRNLNNVQLKMEIESKANDLHKSILALYEASKVASAEFPKIAPMQNIVDKVWSTTSTATQLKKVIFNATCVSA